MTQIAFIKEIKGIEVVFLKDEDNQHYFLYTHFMIGNEHKKMESRYPKTPSGLAARNKLFESKARGEGLEYLEKIITSLERQYLANQKEANS